ncbi:BTAD domain-containing putative transcriptional regulator [Kutzneria sp. CA-103260]|uniref:BTAD domain-containing putative transcriptional regulator n=1 Tax=Kutzneria sp. CA-103260 TaxID=2802641 RepID=UPI001BAA4B7C|nr:BTAD domain-containing putative transcriptional regulator [Kutzneria sp. CA-103260]QUQ62468.1 Bacterial transcriptional activator domain protein [Kutzneria sp. CA-103260]
MTSTSVDAQPLSIRDHDLLRAVGRGLTDSEIADSMAMPRTAVESHLGHMCARLGLRDRAAAIIYAFDHGIVIPGQGLAVDGQLRICLLGPLRAWRGERQLDLGPIRQQALLAALALRPDTTVGQRDLLDGVWGLDQPLGNVVQVYVYRLRKCLQADTGKSDSMIGRDRWGYRFRGAGVLLDTVRLEEIADEAAAAEKAGDLASAAQGCGRALELFHGEPLVGLPGPFADMERLRLTDRRIALSQRKAQYQLRLGRHAEAIDELRALARTHPYSEPVAALLMRALSRADRRADALAVFAEIRRRLVDDLGVEPGEQLRRVRRVMLHEDAATRWPHAEANAFSSCGT